MSDEQPPPAFWDALASTASSLKERWQLTRVEYVPAFSPPWMVSVWLGVETDEDRDRLLRHPDLGDEVAAVLARCGLHEAGGVYDGVVVQSEETVRRDYEGSWFYAMR
jgi:hypothetical protein